MLTKQAAELSEQKLKNMHAKRIGIVGYGHLGKFLAQAVEEHPLLELAFVWNRTPASLVDVEEKFVCTDLNQVADYAPDVIVEVAHPDVTHKYGEHFLSVAHFMIGSPTALADSALEARLRLVADAGEYGLYLPAGALWGGTDIRKLADLGTLESLKITMKKHPSSFKLTGALKDDNAEVASQAAPATLYDGPVRALCPLAPNNVNTMAAAAVAAHNLGFDRVQGMLVSDPGLTDHIVVVEVGAKGGFRVTTERINPAAVGAVTGNATYNSFLSSVVAAGTLGSGVHLC